VVAFECLLLLRFYPHLLHIHQVSGSQPVVYGQKQIAG